MVLPATSPRRSPPLRLAASLRAPGAALGPADLVATLQGSTITEGWDVIFTASLGSNSGTVSWSLLPADGSGTIDQAGNYTPPTSISEPKAIAVVASGSGPSEPISVGVVLLTPPGPNGVATRPGVTRSTR